VGGRSSVYGRSSVRLPGFTQGHYVIIARKWWSKLTC